MKHIALMFLFPSSIFAMDIGVNIHINQEVSSTTSYLSLVQKCGFSSIRDGLSWNRVERSSGDFKIFNDSKKLDVTLNDVKYNAVNKLFVLAYGNNIHTKNGYPKSYDEVDEYIKYVDWISKRYKGKVKYYEVWNEWLDGTGVNNNSNKPPDDIYLDLVKKSYITIKRNDPSALVITGSMNPLKKEQVRWITRLVQNKSFSNYIDGVSIHPYSFIFGIDQNSAENVFSSINSLHYLIDKSAGKRIPLYVTEYGFPSSEWIGWRSYYLRYQNIIKFLLLAKSSGYINGVWLYNFTDDGSNTMKRDDHFGIYKHDLKSKDDTEVLCKAITYINKSHNISIINKNKTYEFDANGINVSNWEVGKVYDKKHWSSIVE